MSSTPLTSCSIGDGNRLGDHLRTGAGIGRAHDDRGRSDLGILREREGLVGDRAYKHNEDGKDRGEDRPVQ